MARVELAVAAVEDLDGLVRTQTLPSDTRARVARSLRALERFPLMGPALNGRWERFRFLLGPWRWMLLGESNSFALGGDQDVMLGLQDGTGPRKMTVPARRRGDEMQPVDARCSRTFEPKSPARCGAC